MTKSVNDQAVLTDIKRLVGEEHRLFEQGSLDEAASMRLAAVQVELDQSWDLLRQRRALREMGQNANTAHVRPAEVVLKYKG
jgi:hypothetical protein